MDHSLPPASPAVPVIPWEDPSRSWFDGLVATVRLLATAPSEAFRGMPPSGGIGRPLSFAIVIGWLGIAAGMAWNVLFQGMWLPFMESVEDLAGMGAMYGLTIGWSLFIAILAPLFITVFVVVAAAVLHLMLLMLGASGGFEATLRVVCYTQTAQLAGLIPCCGGIIGFVWTIVLYVIGFSTAHRITQGTALIAVLLPLVLCCALTAVIVVIAGGVAGLAASR
jgi:hypothetical protein